MARELTSPAMLSAEVNSTSQGRKVKADQPKNTTMGGSLAK